LGGRVHTTKGKAETLVVASKEIGVKVKANKLKHGHVSRKNERRIRSMKIDNSSLERVEEFKCLGKKLTSQYSIQEEIKCRLKSENACYHLVQNRLSSSSLSKELKIQVHRTIILPVFFAWV